MSGKKSWLRISLRTFLLVLTVAAVGLAWFAHQARQRTTAFAAIRDAGGDIRMGLREPSRLEDWFGSDLFGIVNKVDLRESRVDNDLMIHVGVLKELRRIDLSGADIDDQGLRRIAHLPLSELWLQDTNITDASAATISKIKTLSFLQLNATDLSDSFLEQLQPLPQLRDLGLRGTRVTSVGMQYLSRHANLEDLDVYSTEVDDLGVEHLVACQSLTDVGLSMTGITDHVFESLAKLPNLTGADLTANGPVSTKAVLEFERTHPKCDIEWYRK